MQMRFHHAGEIADVAVRRHDIGEALRQRGVGGAAADGIGRALEQRLQRRMIGDGAQGVDAGHRNRMPVAVEVGVDGLDPQQRRQHDLAAARAQLRRRALAIGLWSGDKDTHG